MGNSSGTGLFVGNYDNGIVVANINNAFSGQVTGKLAKKCAEVAPRAVHYLEPDEAAVLYEPLDPAYAEYYERLYGYRPMTFSPRRRYTDLSEPLSLLENILEDGELVASIADHGRLRGWRITPFISHPLVHELGRRTGLPVAGMREDLVRAGRVAELNDKALFQDVCRKLRIPVPPSAHVAGWTKVLAEARRICDRDGKVMLRRARAAGGLGNCEVNPLLLREKGCASVEEYLAAELVPRDEWERETVLVEPVLDVAYSPTTLYRVDDERMRLVADSMRTIRANASLGGMIPSGISRDILDRLVEYGQRYAGYIRLRGASGYFDIDWGVLRDGSIVAFESNYRFTGNNHPVAIRRKLRSDNVGGAVTLSNDALKVSETAAFVGVLAFLEERGANWDAVRGEGVIVTIPPAGGSMGYVAFADSLRQLQHFASLMSEYAGSTFPKAEMLRKHG
jgi:hypothetical protein